MSRDDTISDGLNREYESQLPAAIGGSRHRSVRRWLAAATLATGLAGCVDGPASAEEARNCSDLVDVAVEALVEVRDDADILTRQDFLRGTDRSRLVVEPYTQAMEQIQKRAADFNCNNEQLSEQFQDRLDELEVRSVGGAAILLEAYGFFNPFEE